MPDIPKYAGRAGRKWRKCIEHFKTTYPWVCQLCGGDIPRDVDNQTDKLGYTLHHVYPLELVLREGLDPYDHSNLVPAHRTCNSSIGMRLDANPALVSRQW